MLFDDGDYQSSETPAQKISLRVKDKLWQAIDRAKLSHPLLNDDEMPVATAEQARMQTAHFCCRLAVLAALSRTPHHAQIEDVAVWLAKMARRADWMSNGARSSKSTKIAEVLAKWETRLEHPKDGPKEADKLAARKHRLVALFRSDNCYSANVHACTHGLEELVVSLVRLDKLPQRNPPEGLALLAKAWNERPSKCKAKLYSGLSSSNLIHLV